MNAVKLQAQVRAWRALPDAEKTRRRRATVVDEVVGSMRMEREPASSDWEQRARARLAADLRKDQ